MDELISHLLKLTNVLEARGGQIVFPNAIVATHSALPGEPEHLGVWWYHLPSKRMVYSKDAETHLDSEFRDSVPELYAARIPNKVLANRAGWISGRLGYDNAKNVFAFVYLQELNGHLPGSVAADILQQLRRKSGHSILNLTDEDGYSLAERRGKAV